MYIKLFESLESNKSYVVHYVPHQTKVNAGRMYIENQNHLVLPVEEKELFNLIDKFFKDKIK